VLFFDDDGGSSDNDDIVVRYFLFRTLIDLSSNFSLYRKGVYSVGIKLFNSPTECTKNVCGIPILIKSALNNYLYAHSYSVDKYVIVIVIVIIIYSAFHKIHTDIETVLRKKNTCITFVQ